MSLKRAHRLAKAVTPQPFAGAREVVAPDAATIAADIILAPRLDSIADAHSRHVAQLERIIGSWA